MFSKRYKILIIIILFTVLINGLTLLYLKNTEFPFITLYYRGTVKDFNYNELNLEIPLSQEFKEKVSSDLDPILQDSEDVFFISFTLTDYVRSHLHSEGSETNVVHNVDEILESSEKYPAICSGYSKFFASVAQALGYQSRVVWINGHTISEIYFPNYGWVLVDTIGNLMFQDKDGEYVSLLYMVEYFNSAIPKKIIPEANNNSTSLEEYSVYNKNNLIIVIEGPHLLDFDIRTKSPKVLVNYVFGREDVAKGIQYVGMGRETVGNYRATLIALAAIDFFAFIVFIYCLLKRKKKYVRDSRNLEL
ncbi:transglutaminase-like domain-containing protein [Patescibacteria group bacterium]|nr:transglutaminase-like domain-containing protein [Patescibacteria group bacterium]